MMPEYDYRCPQCDERFSRRTSIQARGNVRCPKCGQKPERIFTAPNVNTGTGYG